MGPLLLLGSIFACDPCGVDTDDLPDTCAPTSDSDTHSESNPDSGSGSVFVPDTPELPGVLTTCLDSSEAPSIAAFTATADALPVTRANVSLSLDSPANAVLTCTHTTETTDVHRLEHIGFASEHRWTVHGLLAESTYDCTVQARCPGGDSATATASLTTGSLPEELVPGTVTVDPVLAMTGAYTMFNHKGFCDGDQAHRLVIVDPEGRVRWYWEGLESDFGVGVVGDYLGDDLILTAGGTGANAGPRVSNLDGDILYETPEDWGLVFHHYAEQLSDGHMLSVAEAEDTLGDETWEGVHLVEHDPETDTIVREWTSQGALDAGERGVWDVGSTRDNLNTNWVSRDPQGAWYLSICGAQRLAKLDPDSGDVIWVMGPREGWTLLDADGAELGADGWPQCQHGVEVLEENRVLVYDNGRDRLEARVSEYVVDPGAGTVTRTWTWTEDNWYEQAWGDVDRLTDDRVLLGIGHCSCCQDASDNVTRILEVDRPSGSVVWRYDFPPDDSVLYQVNRIDGCDLFDNVAYCEGLAGTEQ
jgi:hypothetical protein